MSKEKKKLISIIVPCFNEEDALGIFYNETIKVLKTIKYDYEMILVDDGSKDRTLDIMQELSNKDEHIIYLSFSRNFGKESAMYAGLHNAKGDYVGFIDADLQHPPMLIKKMVEKIDEENYDCVVCRRVNRTGDSKIRTFFAGKFYKIINKISDAQMVDGAGDYRFMNRKMADAILSLTEYNRFSKGIFSWVGFNTYWIEYENVDRIAGTTSWSFIKLVKYAIDGILSFSSVPLEISTFLGILFIIISFFYLIISMICCDVSVLVFLVLLTSGIEYILIGILGEYISKIFLEVKNRPRYIISKTNKKDAVYIK